MKDLHKKFIEEKYDKNNVLCDVKLKYPDNFNFAYDIIDVIGTNEPDRRALIWINENGEEYTFTYGDFKRKSNQVANMLVEHGIKKGDKVLVVLKRHHQFWILAMALEKIGAVIIPATNQLMVKDYEYRFESAEVSYVFATADGEVVDNIDKSLEKYSGIKEKFIVNGNKQNWVCFDTEYVKYDNTFERIENSCDDDMILYFTSGTTGYPKMVVHSHLYAVGHLITAKHWHNVKPDGIHFTISDSGWGKFMWGKMYGQLMMASCVFAYDFNRFISSDILQKIQDYKITSFCAPPTMYRFFIKEGIEKYDLSNLKYATIAGEALNPEVFNKFYEYTGLKLMEGFGQTETVLVVANTVGMEPRPGSMGKAVPLFNVDIVDENNKSVPMGEVGEIVIRTEGSKQIGMFKGYYNNPEATKKAWNNNVFHTGDTAWKDESGYFWYVGRTDDLIKASGYRIGPFEIESVLMEHPSVLEVAVTGAEDPIRGQVVKATIVLSKEYKDKGDEKLIKELQDYVKKATAPYKYPRIVEFVDELPKTISGKIRRVEIRENNNK